VRRIKHADPHGVARHKIAPWAELSMALASPYSGSSLSVCAFKTLKKLDF